MDQHLIAATTAASYNVLLQVMIRVSSFALNGIILRFIQADLLGVVNLRLTLLYTTILFLSREPLRKASLSQTTAERKWRHVFNLLWCSVPLGVLSSSLLSLLWLSPLIDQPLVRWDKVGVAIFSLSAVIELLAEPWWVLGQAHGFVSLKVVAEGVPQVLKCVLVAVGVMVVPQWGVLVFATAQLAYSLGYILIYYGYFFHHLRTHDSHMTPQEQQRLPVKSVQHILPYRDGARHWLSPYLVGLSWSFFKQSFLKQLLTDGERYVMTLFGVLSFAEQGVYDVINNLGSLAARFIFLPIEESFYVFFANTLYRGETVERQKKDSVPLVAQTLSMLLRFVLLTALTILTFGYAYSYIALDIYGGRVLSEGGGPTLLRWYSLYVLLLAVNGVTECFVFAAMSQPQVDRYNGVMLVFSCLFLTAAFFLTRVFGSVGFILANCVNMTVRIVHSCHYIHSYFSPTPHSPLLSALPSLTLLGACALAFLLTSLSEAYLCCHSGWSLRLLHLLVGAMCLCMVALVAMVTEAELFQFLQERLPPRVSKLISMATILPRRLGRHHMRTE